MVVNSLHFFFCLLYPRLKTGEAGSPMMPMGADKKKKKGRLKENLLSLTDRPGKRQKTFRQ